MKKNSTSILVIAMGIILAGTMLIAAAVSAEQAQKSDKASNDVPDGAPIFKDHECWGCHSIKAVGIEIETGEDIDPEDVDEDAPDLSAVGKEHDIDWMKLYLKKKVKQDGEKHEKKFRGPDEEFETLMKWLASMKTEVKGAKKRKKKK